MPGIASSAPPVLIGHLADATSRIRVGSGGVMLPNHVSLVVAEQFGMLEALHPGRIDLGIGRAPGTDQVTAAALRRSPEGLSPDDFPEQLGELIGFFSGKWPAGHPYAAIAAVPGQGHSPSMWLLGSSGYSAQVAGLLGLPFAFAHHFSAVNTQPAQARAGRGAGDTEAAGHANRAGARDGSRAADGAGVGMPAGSPAGPAARRSLPASEERACRPLT
jgi:luciferase family oxidoreductase group 1